MIRVLHVCDALDCGGVEQLLFNYYNVISKDVHFDFLVSDIKIGLLEKKFIKRGCEVYRSLNSHNIRSRLKVYAKILITNKYDVVHIHGGIPIGQALIIALVCGVKVRIVHSHNAYVSEHDKSLYRISIKRFIPLLIINCISTKKLACSKAAAICMFGEKSVNCNRVQIIKNAIPLDLYVFSLEKRKRLRKNLNLQNKFVIGCVGRLTQQKNQSFLIDVFVHVRKQMSNAVLLLVGDGEDKGKLIDKITNLQLQSSIILLGKREDVSDLLNAFDLFILASEWEGLGIVLIESQANGLRTIASSRVPSDAKITNLLAYKSLDESAEEWAREIIQLSGSTHQDSLEEVKTAGYDIKNEVLKLEAIYRSCERG